MIPKLLSSTWMIWMISIKILKNAIQIKDYWSYLMICLLICLVIENIIHKYFSCFYLTILSCYTEKNQHTISLWKFQTKVSFSKSHSIIHQILTFKILWIFTKMYCKTIFVFSDWYCCCLRKFLMFFRKNIRTNHGNWWSD